MRHRSIPFAAFIICTSLTAPALPAQEESGGSTRSDDPANLERSSKLLGMDVRNKDGQNLGRIEDLVFNLNGRVSYAVLSFGGFLGVGEKWFAMPWQILACDQDGKRYTLDISKDRLKNAPGFDKKSWPDMADPKWCAEVSSFYACPESSDRSWGGKASALDDATVKTIAGRKLGEVEDLIIDIGRGFATLVILDTYENVVPKDRLVAIPWGSMTVEPKNDVFVCNSDESSLALAATFTKDSWPILDRAYVFQIYAHFGRNHGFDIPIGDRSRDSGAPVSRGALRTSRLIGLTCRSPTNEDLGVIQDVILVQGRDRMPMIVLDLPGEEGTLHAVPLELCRTDQGSCILSVDADKLRNSPGFSDNAWPDSKDLDWYDEICRYFGLKVEHH